MCALAHTGHLHMMPNLIFQVHLDGAAHKSFKLGSHYYCYWLVSMLEHLVWSRSILVSVKDLISFEILLELGPQSCVFQRRISVFNFATFRSSGWSVRISRMGDGMFVDQAFRSYMGIDLETYGVYRKYRMLQLCLSY